MVSLHCEFCCAQEGFQTVQIVCYKQYIQTVSLLNDFVCVLPGHVHFDNIYHILCTCIYLYEYSYGDACRNEMKNVSHTEYIYGSHLHSVFHCGKWNFYSL